MYKYYHKRKNLVPTLVGYAIVKKYYAWTFIHKDITIRH